MTVSVTGQMIYVNISCLPNDGESLLIYLEYFFNNKKPSTITFICV